MSPKSVQGPMTVPPPLDIFGDDAYSLMIEGVRRRFQPLGIRSTIMLVPKGYDETFRSTKRFILRERKLPGGVRQLYVPFENLVQATLTHTAELDGKVYFLATCEGKQIIVNEKFCADLSAKMIGPFKVPNKK